MMHLLFAAAQCNRDTFIFLPHWWEYLKTSQDVLGQCSVDFNFPSDVLPVGLAVIDILLRIAGFIAVIAIIVAGIQHLFTGGNPEKAASARRRLFSAILGLLIALLATATVTFIGNQLTS
jgi:hypothetical protein